MVERGGSTREVTTNGYNIIRSPILGTNGLGSE